MCLNLEAGRGRGYDYADRCWASSSSLLLGEADGTELIESLVNYQCSLICCYELDYCSACIHLHLAR